MFSSNDLISFVFANENDTYYRDDLLKLNQDQQLWYLLHEHFDTVYFLRNTDGQLQVSSFGDCKGGPCPVFKDKFLTSADEQLGKWIRQQLRGKGGRTAALVCSMKDFCDKLSKAQWSETLCELAKDPNRTGILVLTASATAERNTQLLLSSPVFAYLQEAAVTDLRGGQQRDLYETLYQRKNGSCFFFNEFQWERVYALLLHVVMEKPQRMTTKENLEKLTDFLYNYLNATTTTGTDPLFGSPLPRYYLTYRELYTKLCKEQVWERLEERAAKDIKAKLRQGVPILRDRNSCAGKCMQLKLPSWIDLEKDEGVRIFRLLREIREMAAVPKNRLENQQVQEAANDFLDLLDTVPGDDPVSYTKILSALKLCLEWAHMDPAHPKAEQLQSIIQYQKELVGVLQHIHAMKRNLKNLLLQESKHIIHEKTTKMLQAEIVSAEKMRDIYEEVIQTAIWELSAPDTERSAERLKGLVEKVEGQRKQAAKVSTSDLLQHQLNKVQPKEEDNDEDEFDLDLVNADYIPPGH